MIRRDDCYICSCDVKGCQAELNAKRDVAWMMYEITFGIDPSVLEIVKKPVPVVKQRFHFCNFHRGFFRNVILSMIRDADTVCLSSQLKDGYGCWITFIDVLEGRPIENYQIRYEDFASIWERFINYLREARTGQVPYEV